MGGGGGGRELLVVMWYVPDGKKSIEGSLTLGPQGPRGSRVDPAPYNLNPKPEALNPKP